MRRTLLALALLASSALPSLATSITLDPSKGQTLEKWLAKPDRAVTDVHLLAGDHGSPRVQGLSNLYVHGDAGTILHRTWIVGSSNITFRWVHFEGLKGTDTAWQNALLWSDSSSPHLTVDSSTFDGAPLATAAGWTNDQWLTLPYGQLVYSNSDAAVFTNNDFGVTYTVMSINGDGWVVARNRLHDYANDGIDFRGSNVSIHDNHIYDLRGVSKQHQDGIQGMAATPRMAQPYTNVDIEHNVVDAGLLTSAPMQGISAFDGLWKNVTIRGNWVRCRAYHAITWSGVTDINIDGNTVQQFLDANGKPVVDYPVHPVPWINVSDAKGSKGNGDAGTSSGVVVGHNITPQYAGAALARMHPAPVPVSSLP